MSKDKLIKIITRVVASLFICVSIIFVYLIFDTVDYTKFNIDNIFKPIKSAFNPILEKAGAIELFIPKELFTKNDAKEDEDYDSTEDSNNSEKSTRIEGTYYGEDMRYILELQEKYADRICDVDWSDRRLSNEDIIVLLDKACLALEDDNSNYEYSYDIQDFNNYYVKDDGTLIIVTDIIKTKEGKSTVNKKVNLQLSYNMNILEAKE